MLPLEAFEHLHVPPTVQYVVTFTWLYCMHLASPLTSQHHALCLCHTGSFAYIDSAGRQAGDYAMLQLTLLLMPMPDNYVFCLDFFYHMFGDDIGRLEVATDQEGVVWSRAGRTSSTLRLLLNISISSYSIMFVYHRTTFFSILIRMRYINTVFKKKDNATVCIWFQ